MNKLNIDYTETGFFNKTVTAYMDGDQSLRPFYPYEPSVETIPSVIENLQQSPPVNRTLLVEEVTAQYERAGLSALPPRLKENIESLASPKTFTITTAHQLNLFGGPLYYMLKIANTIRVARDLSKAYPGHRFVPCYWMGSEDHDFEEVNHTYLFNKKITWDHFQDGPMGTYSTEGIAELIPEVIGILRTGPHLEELEAILSQSYAHPVMADAVRAFLLRLFGEEGLVVVDGSTAAFKSVFTPVIKDELKHRRSETLVTAQIGEMDAAGFKAQAGPREINLFYMEGRSRERIVPTDNGFELAESGHSFSEAELFRKAEEHPELFSPNVILRPLHQQMVLPNLIYIGGGSEVAYWLQLSGLFKHYHVHFPMLLARTSVQVMPPHILKKLEKLGIVMQDIFKDTELLKKEFVARNQDLDLALDKEKQQVQELFDKLAAKAASIDPTLEGWTGAEGQKAYKSIENISKRLVKAEKQRNDLSMHQIEKLKDQLFPDGQLTERRENFMTLYANGGKEWLRSLIADLDPFEQKFSLIY